MCRHSGLPAALFLVATLGAVAVAPAALAAQRAPAERGASDRTEILWDTWGVNGAPGDPLGVFRAAAPAPGPDGKFVVIAGDTYYAAVEFARPVRTKALLAYGNATRPGSPHRGDQLDLFAKQQMREIWRTRAEIAAHLERRDAF